MFLRGSARSRQQEKAPEEAKGERGPPRKFVRRRWFVVVSANRHTRGILRSCWARAFPGLVPAWLISRGFKERVRLEIRMSLTSASTSTKKADFRPKSKNNFLD
jgi:hypothetical protein